MAKCEIKDPSAATGYRCGRDTCVKIQIGKAGVFKWTCTNCQKTQSEIAARIGLTVTRFVDPTEG